MSSVISVRHNFPRIAAQLDRLPVTQGRKALARAINTSLKQGETAAAREIAKSYRLTVAKVKERLNVRKAQPRGGLTLEGVLEASDPGKARGMNLIAFVEGKVSLAEAKRRAKRGTLQQLHFQIKRSGGQKTIPGAFIGNRGRTVFVRVGRQRLPIKPLTTIGVPQMFNARPINAAIVRVLNARLPANFARELRAVLGGYVK